MSFSETVFLFVLALIIFGPKKLPEIARQVGKYMNEFKRASNEFKAQIEQEISNLEIENRQTILPPSPSPEGVTSRTLSAASSEVNAAELAPTGAAATRADSDDEPLFAASTAAGNGAGSTDPAPVAGESVSTSDVTSPASQESHA